MYLSHLCAGRRGAGRASSLLLRVIGACRRTCSCGLNRPCPLPPRLNAVTMIGCESVGAVQAGPNFSHFDPIVASSAFSL